MSYPHGHRVVCDLCPTVLIEGTGSTIWGRCEFCAQREEQRRKKREAIERDPFHGLEEGE